MAPQCFLSPEHASHTPVPLFVSKQAATARARKQAKDQAPKGSQLKVGTPGGGQKVSEHSETFWNSSD